MVLLVSILPRGPKMPRGQNIVLVPKRAKWERDLQNYGSREATLSIYKKQNEAFAHVFASHQRQKENLEKVKNALPEIRCVERKELSALDLKNFRFLISFGGDNHFVYTAQKTRGLPILGLNSDPQSSTGALLYFDSQKLISALKNYIEKETEAPLSLDSLDPKSFLMEHWTRIEGELALPDPEQGQEKKIKLSPCISEISIRSSFHDHISRFLLRKNDEEWEELKCSGLLLACGAGSSGWYRNAHPDPQNAVFSKEAPFFRSLARETQFLSRGKLKKSSLEIGENESLEIISEMDGEITIDANTEEVHPFPPGARASFSISNEKLKVIRGFC